MLCFFIRIIASFAFLSGLMEMIFFVMIVVAVGSFVVVSLRSASSMRSTFE